MRCEKIGNKFEITEHRIFGPKCFGGLDNGRLPDTVMDRCIRTPMERKLPAETVVRKCDREAAELADTLLPSLKALHLSEEIRGPLRRFRQERLDELNDRTNDITEPLFAIAHLAGGKWPALARVAILDACAETSAENSLGGETAEIHWRNFRPGGCQCHFYEHSRYKLADEEDGPWGDMWDKSLENGDTKSAGRKIARMLKKYGIAPEQIRVGNDTNKGCKVDWFMVAFDRYAPDISGNLRKQWKQPCIRQPSQAITKGNIEETAKETFSSPESPAENVSFVSLVSSTQGVCAGHPGNTQNRPGGGFDLYEICPNGERIVLNPNPEPYPSKTPCLIRCVPNRVRSMETRPGW